MSPLTEEQKKERRKQRQRVFSYRVTLTFVVFCLFAAPLQFHIDWYSGLTNGNPHWFSSALKSAPLYFYALILSIEAFLRLEHYPSLLKHDKRIILLRILLVLPIFVFIMEFFVTPYYRSSNSLPNFEQWAQVLTGLIAFFLSTLVHKEITRQEIRRIR